MTLPALRHLVQTNALRTRPWDVRMRIFWTLGLNVRLDRPVILRPAPPLTLAIPRRAMEPPRCAFLSQIMQFFAMIGLSV